MSSGTFMTNYQFKQQSIERQFKISIPVLTSIIFTAKDCIVLNVLNIICCCHGNRCTILFVLLKTISFYNDSTKFLYSMWKSV